MIVDSSAIMALLLNEPEQELFNRLLITATARRMSAGTWIELAAVTTRRSDDLSTALNRIMANFRITIEPVSVEQAEIGHQAYRKYGIGTTDPAKLNFGDCFSYALAKAIGEPLLFKGTDFSKTDIIAAAK